MTWQTFNFIFVMSIFFIGSFFSKGVNAQQVSPTKISSSMETDIPESQHEYGLWLEKQAKKNRALRTPTIHRKLPPMPDPPSNLNIESGNGMVLMKWDSMPNAIAYVIYVSEDGKKFKRRYKKPVKSTTLELGILENERKYYFGISSVAAFGKESKMIVRSVVPKKNSTLRKYRRKETPTK